MLSSRGRVWVLCALGVVAGCGGNNFELAPEPPDVADAASETASFDTSASDDTEPLDDSATPDTSTPDTQRPDTTSVDTSVAVDSGIDTAVVETSPVDTGATEIGVDAGPVCVPAPESCNGRDDDCNGVIDDGVAGTSCGVGACRRTVAGCTGGVATVCVPGTPATTDTTCDGVDDDCNGVVDDGCIRCDRYVMTGGIGAGTSPSAPMASIQAAINSLTSGNVCVAAAGLAGTCSSATYSERVNVKEGVSVYGGFKYGLTAWTRGDSACVTIIQDVASVTPLGLGVYFTHSITNATQLDGFTIRGATVTGTASAGITMQGAGRVTNNIIVGGVGPISYGMQLIGTSLPSLPAPQIIGNSISGADTTSSSGVRASYIAPEIRGNRLIAGGAATNNSKGIELANARGSIVVDNGSITGASGGSTAGIEISGDSSNIVIARNAIVGGSGSQGRGVTVFGSTPSGRISILANTSISASGGSSYGIDVPVSGASVLIDGNARIVGKTAAGGAATGVRCTSSGTTCTISNNTRIAGYDAATGGDGRGIHIAAAATAAIRKNAAIVGCAVAGNGCTGVHLEGASPSDVDGNVFAMNRGTYASALVARWTNTTIRNNVVWVGGGSGIALDVRPSTSGAFEAVVTSNTVIAPPPTGTAIPNSYLLVVDNETLSGPPNGIFRNNIAVCLGTGTNRTAFQEFGGFAEPRVFENNDLFGCNTLYRDQETGALTSLTAINSLADVPVKGNNVSVDPSFVSGDYHLSSISTLIDKGTSASCPAYDIDGNARPARLACDIGADEVP